MSLRFYEEMPPHRIRKSLIILVFFVAMGFFWEASRAPAPARTAKALGREAQEAQQSTIAELSPEVLAGHLDAENTRTALGLTQELWEQIPQQLSQAIRENVAEAEFCVQQPRLRSVNELCEAIGSLESGSEHRDRQKRLRLPSIRLTKNSVPILQRAPWEQVQRSLRRTDPADFLVEVPSVLAVQECPHRLSLLGLRHLEDLLPDAKAQQAMEQLYVHAQACVPTSDTHYEGLHFRQALLRELWGLHAEARESMDKALLTKDPKDLPRLLYWGARWNTQPGRQRALWEQLVQERPLSFHSLLGWSELERDPYDLLLHRSSTASFDLGAATESSWVHWVEALVLKEKGDEAQWLARWLYETHREILSPARISYMAMILSQASSHLDTISFVSRVGHDNPELLNLQMLKLLYPKPYFEVVDRASPDTDTYLILGLARQESAFNPRARSRANAKGLLQILPSTAEAIERRSSRHLFDVETNASVGVRYFQKLVERFGSVEGALAAYNAGPEKVESWKLRYPTEDKLLFLDLIPYRETRNYVPSILRNNYWYRRLYTPGQIPDVRAPASTNIKSELVEDLIRRHGDFREAR